MKRKSGYAYLLLAKIGLAILVTVGAMTYKEAALRSKEL